MFDAHGTEGLELFTWIVAGILGLVAALVFTNALITVREDHAIEGVEEAEEEDDHKEKETVA